MRSAALATAFAVLALSGCAGGAGGEFGVASDIGTVAADERITEPAIQRAALMSAEEAMAQGRGAQALDLYRRAYEGSPTPAIAARRGQAMRALGQLREAQTFLAAASRRFPSDLTLTTELARASLDTGDLPTATQAVGTILDSRGTGYAQYQVAGAFYARQNDIAKADQLFGQAESVAPGALERGNAQANRALLLAQQGDVAGARQRLEAIASTSAASQRTWAVLAVMRGAAGDTLGATEAARRSGMSSPEISEMSRWLGNSPAAVDLGYEEGRPRPRPRRRPVVRQAGPAAETSQLP